MKKLKLLFDGRMAENLGIGRVIKYLVLYLSQQKEFNLAVIGDKNNFPNICAKFFKVNANSYSLKEQTILRKKINQLNADIFFSPHYSGPIFLNKNIKTIIMVHDLIHFFHPFYRRSGKFIFTYLMLLLRGQQTKKIITVSQYTKQDLIKLFPQFKNKTQVIYDVLDSSKFYPLNKKKVKGFKEVLNLKRYLLYVGNTKPHKRVDFLINIIYTLKTKYNFIIPLVIVGRKDKNYFHLKKLISKLKLKSNILFFWEAADKDLLYFYNGCEAFLFASEYEGFGLPPLEAISCGKPVIAINKTAISEVLQDSALLLDNYDVDLWCEKIIHLLEDKKLKQQLNINGKKVLQNYLPKKILEEFKKEIITL